MAVARRQKKSKDKKPLVELDGAVLTVEDFVKMITSSMKRSKESIIDNWIDRKVVDQEALRRHYEANPELKKMVHCYENQVLRNTFIKRIIIPQIAVKEKDLEDYYAKHQKNYIKPARFKMQQITVKTMDEAQEIAKNLQNGADFSWLAKRKSIDSAASAGGDVRWLTKAELPKPVNDIIDTLNIGDTSPIVKLDSSFGVFRIQGKIGEEIEAFDKVKNTVYKAYVNEKVNALIDKYVNQLKTDAQIKIYENEIQAIEKKFKQ